jgi:preprotein translocase subunit SecD
MSTRALPQLPKLLHLARFPKLPKWPRIDPVVRNFFLIVLMTAIAALIALPKESSFVLPLQPTPRTIKISRPDLNITIFGQTIQRSFELKQGLDIQGGTQVILRADMKDIPAESRVQALEAAKAVIQRRVDLYGVSEPVVQTSQTNGEYRIVVELAGVKDTNQALSLIGQTALLDFRIHKPSGATPSAQLSPLAFLTEFQQE